MTIGDAYVDGEDIPDDELMCEYGDSLEAFRRLAEQEGTE